MIRLVTLCVIVFFKQKTAYELRISDWSSDVCSSDLNRALTERPELARPSIVVPRSCHPSIDKAAHYLGLEVRRVPISDAFRADPAAIAEAIDDSTIMLVASAPGYTHGVFDPVAEFGAIAEARGLWLHVDACLGGLDRKSTTSELQSLMR